MTEYDKIWLDWEDGKERARQTGRGEPVLCVMDPLTYNSFLGALQIKIHGVGWKDTMRSRVGPFSYEGIYVWPACRASLSGELNGMFFAYEDEGVIL